MPESWSAIKSTRVSVDRLSVDRLSGNRLSAIVPTVVAPSLVGKKKSGVADLASFFNNSEANAITLWPC